MSWKNTSRVIEVAGGIFFVFLTVLFFITDAKAVLDLFGNNLSWKWWVFSLVIACVVFGWRQTRLDKENKALKKALDNPILKEKQAVHYSNIERLIKELRDSIRLPPIEQIESAILPTDKLKDDFLFGCLKEHLPNNKLWTDFSEWESKARQYIKKCTELKENIGNSWKVQGTATTSEFSSSIVDYILSGKQYLFRLSYNQLQTDRLEYQKLFVNSKPVIVGLHSTLGKYHSDEQEFCNQQILCREYLTIVEQFVNTPASIEVKQLNKELQDTADTLVTMLRSILEKATHIGKHCNNCPNNT